MVGAPSDAVPGTHVPERAILQLHRIAARAAHKIGAENFPVALRALPSRVRDDLVRAYMFARFVDDVGDEATGNRKVLLDIVDRDVQALVERLYQSPPNVVARAQAIAAAN